jgi:hypothetical protein
MRETPNYAVKNNAAAIAELVRTSVAEQIERAYWAGFVDGRDKVSDESEAEKGRRLAYEEIVGHIRTDAYYRGSSILNSLADDLEAEYERKRKADQGRTA